MAIRVVLSIFLAMVVDGIDLQVFALALPSLTKDLQLTNLMAGSLATWAIIGMALGGVVAGILADKIGRIRVLMGAIAVFSIATMLLGFTHTYWQFAFIRFISGFGISALSVLAPMTASEYVPTKYRTTILAVLQAGWSVGFVIAALLSAWILPHWGWRPLFIQAIFPGIVCIGLFYGIKDSDSYTAARNNKALERPGSEWVRVLSNRSLLITVALWSITSIALQFGYHGASTWLPSYLAADLGINFKNAGFYLAGTYTAMIFGKILAGLLADKFGRRRMWVITGIAAAVAFPLVMHYANVNNVIYLLPLFGFIYGAPFAINHTYMSESFPTEVRGTAIGMAYNMGRLGAFLSPIFVGALATSYTFTYAIASLGVAYALCAVIPGIFIREKMYDPQSTGDGENASLKTPRVGWTGSRTRLL